MDNNYSEVLLLIDASGSMLSTVEDVRGGLTTFIKEQQKLPGKCVATIVAFDSRSVKDELFSGDVKDFNPDCLLKYQAVGSTPLYDAFGFNVTKLGQKLAIMKEQDRPSKVSVIVYTDGYENCSREYNRNDVVNLKKQQEEVYSWTISFLGGNFDTNELNLNLSAGQSISYNKEKTYDSFAKMSSKFTTYRSTGSGRAMAFNDQDARDLA